MLSLYIPGSSLVHRVPAWIKLVILCVGGVAVMITGSWRALSIALAAVFGMYIIARIPARVSWRMVQAIVLVVAVIAGAQWAFSSWMLALIVALRILIIVLAANLVTLTTPVSSLIDVVEAALSPLRRFGVRPERVGLAVSLALRFIPVITEQSALIRQAQAARGAKSASALMSGILIRTVRMADGVGEALEARGMD